MQTSIAAALFSLTLVFLLETPLTAQLRTNHLTTEPQSKPVEIEKLNERPSSRAESSIRDYESLFADSPEDAIILNNLGVMYYRAGRYFEAQSMIRKAAFQAPQSLQIRVNLALALHKTHNPAYAISTLQLVLNEDPKHDRARQALCEIYMKDDLKAEALDCYEAMRNSGKMEALSAANYSTILIERGELDRALDLLSWADATFPSDAAVKNSLGIALHMKKKYADAEKNLQRAVALEPKSPKVRYNLAIVQMATNKRGSVLEQYKYLKTADPELAGKLHRIIFRNKIVSAAPRR